MNSNVLVMSGIQPGTVVTASNGTSTVTSTADAHSKVRLRLTPGLWTLSRGNVRMKVDMPGSAISYGFTKLIREDAEYLEWLELSTAAKIAAYREQHPLARWATGLGVAR